VFSRSLIFVGGVDVGRTVLVMIQSTPVVASGPGGRHSGARRPPAVSPGGQELRRAGIGRAHVARRRPTMSVGTAPSADNSPMCCRPAITLLTFGGHSAVQINHAAMRCINGDGYCTLGSFSGCLTVSCTDLGRGGKNAGPGRRRRAPRKRRSVPGGV
jgi:hypothetical protein